MVQAQERVTVNLSVRGATALAKIREREQRDRTEVVNRALLLYDMLTATMEAGGSVTVREPGAEPAELRFL